jgi:hypothetical protein
MSRESAVISRPFRSVLLVVVPAILLLIVQLDYFGPTVKTVAFLPGWLVVDDLISEYSLNSFTVVWLGRVSVSWFFWIVIFWIVSRLARRKYIAAAVVLAVLTIAFGWLSFRTTASGPYTFDRHWGFITHATADSNRDGQVDVENWYSWREPLMDAHSPPLRTRSDQDYDGAWDTWVDYEANTLRIDTDGDGVSDVTLQPDYEGYEEARRLRGFGW